MMNKICKAILAMCLCMAFDSQAATIWDLATDFYSANQGNSPWELGYLNNGNFSQFTNYSPNIGNGWAVWFGGNTDIALNATSTASYGILPGNISLEADSGTPVARFVAPFTATYNINVAIGGSTAWMAGGVGNYDAILAGLNVNGNAEAYTSFNNNQMVWILNNVQLNQGQIIDAYVGQHYIGGNTDTVFTVTTATPIPAAIWLAGSAVVGLGGFFRRKTV